MLGAVGLLVPDKGDTYTAGVGGHLRGVLGWLPRSIWLATV